jgi:hypothetical protein
MRRLHYPTRVSTLSPVNPKKLTKIPAVFAAAANVWQPPWVESCYRNDLGQLSDAGIEFQIEPEFVFLVIIRSENKVDCFRIR